MSDHIHSDLTITGDQKELDLFLGHGIQRREISMRGLQRLDNRIKLSFVSINSPPVEMIYEWSKAYPALTFNLVYIGEAGGPYDEELCFIAHDGKELSLLRVEGGDVYSGITIGFNYESRHPLSDILLTESQAAILLTQLAKAFSEAQESHKKNLPDCEETSQILASYAKARELADELDRLIGNREKQVHQEISERIKKEEDARKMRAMRKLKVDFNDKFGNTLKSFEAEAFNQDLAFIKSYVIVPLLGKAPDEEWIREIATATASFDGDGGTLSWPITPEEINTAISEDEEMASFRKAMRK